MTSEQRKFSSPNEHAGAPMSPLAWWRDFNLALGLLTRLPSRAGPERRSLSGAAGFFPLAGLFVGGVMALPIAIGSQLHLPAEVLALLAVLASVWFTRGLHEDGLADTADGLGGGRSIEQKLSIMRDSRVGTFGVLALVASIGARWLAVTALISLSVTDGVLAVVAAASVSRLSPIILMRLLPPARHDGLSFAAGRPAITSIFAALAIGAVVLYLSLDAVSAAAAVVGLVGGVAFTSALAWRHLRGQTGDVLGAAQQVSEAAILLAVLVSWTA